MGTGFYINGQKYISSKDAYIASGYSEDKLLRLCFEKKIKSQGFKGGYFIEAQSLLKYVKTNTKKKSRKYFQRHSITFCPQWIDDIDQELFKIAYISDSRTLINFAAKMRNCAFDYLQYILSGEFQFYMVEIEYVTLLMLLGGAKEDVQLVDCKGCQNTNLNVKEMYHLSTYLHNAGVK